MEPKDALKKGLQERLADTPAEAEEKLAGHRAEARWLSEHKSKKVVAVELDGKRIEGTLVDFDGQALFIERGGKEKDVILLYRGAVQRIERIESVPD